MLSRTSSPDLPSSWLQVFLGMMILLGSGQNCSFRCKCLVQEKVVFCNSRNLTTVPIKIPPDSEFLDLSQNSLRTLYQGMFSRLQALKELDLSYNIISNIEQGAFNGLQKIMTLRLAGNKLKMIPDGVFTGLPNLSVLDLRDNKILVFLDHTFKDLFSLGSLDIRNNPLVLISGQAFRGLQHLRRFTLQKCNFTSLPTEALFHLHHLVELHLNVLDLRVLHNYSFRKLHKLKILEINQWPFLKILEPHSLSGLNLTSLYIVRCNLHDVPYRALKHLVHLHLLDLSYNPISKIRGRKLLDLSRLREFHLTGGRLATIQANAFEGLVHFRLLNVSANHLRTLEERVFHSVGNLEVLRLDQNPLACDCRLLWILKRRQRLNFEAQLPICATSSEEGGEKVFHDFSSALAHHFTCRKSTIENKTFQKVVVHEGEQANLTCSSDGDPPPSISWVNPQNITLDSTGKGRSTVLPDGTLKILYVLLEDSGLYRCVASNAAGNDSMVASLQVLVPLFNQSLVWKDSGLRNKTAISSLFFLHTSIWLGILTIGIVPFLCSVLLCFTFIFLYSRGRGNVTHQVIHAETRPSRGYKAIMGQRRPSPKKSQRTSPRKPR
ncbi:leucine-rich repeat and immunoglobulin-like domain-containing nogo receptor-interacting protein 4 [Ahaetulla prasina]|uniref:leucine-rich repeat and immunoglobulin-like domain-containing nogo receptor-interacting protein 4 n=1 Tax=Ahaetulla prasina TaxID=499056 RepID=UPI002649CE64|nr:leucine-rich repeat and immunoglobulin-like domain-containing nogo receptor-interacting protein 4 [Ahaetulla prasina]XP_058015767.1 leucine-rich repeat and immunoglobulin-like domain-containing nogo receptor-interacting protein 4 [Ahaetulla prasina]XP_058015768.1 leucine-rich repeat and immunoglobulin-like domain-containing nogo receptor-interacting protein 4 [Ahaetulla prasina]